MAKNVVIAFDYKSKQTDIKAASGTIISVLAPGCEGATFSKNVAWSKVAISSVPCQRTDAEVMDLDDAINEQTGVFTAKELEDEIRSAHPLLGAATFTLPPSWATKPEIVRQSDVATVSFALEDPDGSIINALTRLRIVLFGKLVSPRAWKERVDLKQCQKCWGFVTGSPHAKCVARCRICSSQQHTSDMHNVSCPKCKDTGELLDRISSVDWVCIHPKCRNCTNDHEADNESCPARDATIATARAKLRGGHAGQTILDPLSLRSRPPGGN